MGEKEAILDSILIVLKDGPKSISDVSAEAKVNWRTAESYLGMLKTLNKVEERIIKNTRTFYYKDDKHLFTLPIKPEDEKKIASIYYHIKQFCNELYQKEPTKTQVYKILWKLNVKPTGWYKYGPCAVKPYTGNETEETTLQKQEITDIKLVTKEYCRLDNLELQNKIYTEAQNGLYITKDLIQKIDNPTKEEIYSLLSDLMKYAPDETHNIIEDYLRATLLLGFEKTKQYFKDLWEYITKVNFRNSLKEYYEDAVDIYFNNSIEQSKKEIQIDMYNAVKSYMDSKYSGDGHYQQYVKRHQSQRH